MRAILTALFVFTAAAFSHAAELSLVRVWPAYRPAESFERLSEYFGKNEDPAAHHILRTQPAERAGYYFLVRLKNKGAALAGTRFELQLITPFATELRSYTFAGDIPSGNHAFHLGLTGSDWPGKPKDESVAWKLRVLGSDGAELLQSQSYLWALPEKK
ncbi:MAG: hypothetical protein QM715_07665 [Nibricoccus sp.]